MNNGGKERYRDSGTGITSHNGVCYVNDMYYGHKKLSYGMNGTSYQSLHSVRNIFM